jgi:hypothetical protein
MSHIYCPECGFQNPEAANYCAKCGALLHERESESVEQTQTFTPEDRDELLETLGDIGVEGPALVVRSGGGRAGETFTPQDERTSIGRSPDCGIFLDDVTVSRKHAVLVRQEGRWIVEDQGSLNGTFVNRKRVETAELEDGDELQIGKYRLTFLKRCWRPRPPSASAFSRSEPCAGASRRSSRTSRSRRSATSRIRAC